MLEQIHFIGAQLLSVKELNDVVKNGSDQEALFMKKQIGDDVKRVTDSYRKIETEPNELPAVKFAPVKKYKEVFPQFGRLFDDAPVPNNCEVTAIPNQPLVAGNRLDLTIITKNSDNKCWSKGGSPVVVQTQ